MRRSFAAIVIGAWGMAVVFAATASPQTPPKPGVRTMRIELDAYSGRPNPSWHLTPQQGEDFLKRLRALPEERGGKSVRDGLGYRGFIVTGGTDLRGFEEVVVSNGIVLGRRDGTSQKFADPDRLLEKWLLRTGKGHVEMGVYDEIAKELGLQDD